MVGIEGLIFISLDCSCDIFVQFIHVSVRKEWKHGLKQRRKKKPFSSLKPGSFILFFNQTSMITSSVETKGLDFWFLFGRLIATTHHSTRGMPELLFYCIDKAKPMNLTQRLIHNASLYLIYHMWRNTAAQYNPIKFSFSIFHRKMYFFFLMIFVSPPFSVGSTTWCWPGEMWWDIKDLVGLWKLSTYVLKKSERVIISAYHWNGMKNLKQGWAII